MTRILISFLVLLALPAAAARACSCADLPSPLDAMEEAAAVFSGQVVSAERLEGNSYHYTIRVYAVWKGPSPDLIEVWTSDVAMCGLWMGVGSEFLVYAYDDESALSTHNCSRSAPLQFAGQDLIELGSPLTVGNDNHSMTALKARYE